MSIRNDNPQFEIVEPQLHDSCGHAHHSFQSCPVRGAPCGSFICCQPDDGPGDVDTEKFEY